MGGGIDRRPDRLRFMCALAFSVTAFLAAAASASAAPVQITAAERGYAFVGGPFEQPRGEVAEFVNPPDADAPHNVEATGTGPDGWPLFYSRTVPGGEQVEVRGTQYLESGLYPFVCSLHRESMTGTLRVTDSGTAVSRPSVRLAIPTQRLGPVTRKRILRVNVTSPTGVSDGLLWVRIGGRTIGRPIALDLALGGRLAAKVRIPARSARAFKRKRSLQVTAQARVPFGSKAKAKRVIR